jgi:ribosomal protein L16 Arg81 hydroxylase
MPVQSVQIKACFAAGMTICVGNVDRFLPDLAAQSQELRRSLGFGGELCFSCYHSPDAAGFGLHYDDRPVFICQLSGSKRWWYSREPAMPAPIGNYVYRDGDLAKIKAKGLKVHIPGEDEMECAVLEPGDMLYLPAGAWHKTSAAGESLALTLRMRDRAADQLFGDALRRLCQGDSAWRQPLPLGEWDWVAAGLTPEPIRTVLADRLEAFKEWAAGLSVADLERVWASGQVAQAKAAPVAAPAPEVRIHG